MRNTSLPAALFLLAAIAAGGAAAQTPPAAAPSTPPRTPSVLGQVPVVKPPPNAKPKPVHAKPKPAKSTPAAKPAPTPKAAIVTPVPPVVAPPATPPPKLDPNKGTATGLKVPRWVSLRTDEVNLRTGPGMQYPIDWQYHRRDLPVRVVREYEVWRLIETQDGSKGWVHSATLTGRRGLLIVDPEKILRAGADETAAPVAKLEPGVVGRIRDCEAAKSWCEVQVGEYRGFLKRSDLWGVDADEAVN